MQIEEEAKPKGKTKRQSLKAKPIGKPKGLTNRQNQKAKPIEKKQRQGTSARGSL